MPQESNPDIIEGPPLNIDPQVGAINPAMLDEFEVNEVSILDDYHEGFVKQRNCFSIKLIWLTLIREIQIQF